MIKFQAVKKNYRSILTTGLLVILLFSILSCDAKTQNSSKIEYPTTDQKPITTNIHEIDVVDQYRWLEKSDHDDVMKWSREQNSLTRSIIDDIPSREQIKGRLDELLGGQNIYYYSLKNVNEKLFAMKKQPPLEQSLLVVMDSPDDPSTEKIVVDVNTLDTTGKTSIDFFVPSYDASLLAVSMSEFGSEKGTVYIFDVSTGEKLSDFIPNVNGPTAGGDVAWEKDNSGFLYTRYPHAGERDEEDLSFYQQVYYHKIGTPSEKDKYEIGEEFPRIAEIEFESSADGNLFIAAVANGDGGEYAHYLKDKKGNWSQITKFDDYVRYAKFSDDNSIFMLSRKDAPNGKILKLKPGSKKLSQAELFVKESNKSIKEYIPTNNYLYVTEIDGGPISLKVYDSNKKMFFNTPDDQIVSLRSLTTCEDNMLINISSYTDPSAWYRFNPKTKELNRTALYRTSPADFSDIEVTRKFAISKDGTEIPMNILHPKGIELDGQNPTMLYGYGGYGISLSPYFDSKMRIWFDQGGIYVVANIRGGGEYGEEWHLNGNLTKKQNVFDDFAACAQYLIDNKYTKPDKFVIKGGSNGGLLMGAVTTQHPKLFAAVVASVGVFDMIRVEHDPNGEFNITEFGTIKNKEQFEALIAYSPLHNVTEGVKYPAMILLTGEHDGRVNPYHSRKMTAALQNATSSSRPILYRSSSTSGHGGGTALSEQIEKESDIFAFVFDQLKMSYKHD